MMRLIQRLLLASVVCWPSLAVAQAPPATIEYHHVDALGSIRAVTNASGAVVRRHDYFPFGEAVGVEPGTDPLRFTGKERDAETGLDYFGARYYAQRLGRLTTVDPALDLESALLDPQRWNRYSYALNAPGNFVDPDGRNPVRIAQLLHRVAQGVIGSSRVRAAERVLNRWSDKLLDAAIRLASPPQPVLPGETTERVAA
jgi:RHS repeat-associated protein